MQCSLSKWLPTETLRYYLIAVTQTNGLKHIIAIIVGWNFNIYPRYKYWEWKQGLFFYHLYSWETISRLYWLFFKLTFEMLAVCRQQQINAMAVDALAPGFTRSSAAIILSV